VPPETDFTDTVIQGALEITTYFRRGRRGSRPFRRVTRRIGSGDEGGALQASEDKQRMAALRFLNEARAKGVRRMSEASFRGRLARAGGDYTIALVDAMVSEGIAERDERLDPQGNPLASYLTLTARGDSVLSSVFGPVNTGSLDELARRLEDMLSTCRTPVIAGFLQRQLGAARAGGPVCLETGEDAPFTFISIAATSGYLKVLEFFGFVGAHPPGESLDFKEVSGGINRGERDSVKMLENLRTTIARVAEADIGVPLDELGIRGVHLLYWIPFCGDLRPDGHAIWGSVPAISTRDVRTTRVFKTSASVVALVENRAALEHLSDSGAATKDWLTLCTDGMPKRALYELLSRIDGAQNLTYVVWTDWDLGGLRIAEKLLDGLTSRAATSRSAGDAPKSGHRDSQSASVVPRVVLVPHPQMMGRKIDVPDGYPAHGDPRIRAMAMDIAAYGAVYQEETFSTYPLHVLEGIVAAAREG
jgi:hypothetical protein